MECACLYNEGEPIQMHHVETRKARREHRCCECREPIAVGQSYEYVSGKFEGDFFRQRTCLLCVEIAKALYCEGRVYGLLWLDIEEQIFGEGAMNSACLDELSTPAAKQFLQRRWWAWIEKQQPPDEAHHVSEGLP